LAIGVRREQPDDRLSQVLDDGLLLPAPACAIFGQVSDKLVAHFPVLSDVKTPALLARANPKADDHDTSRTAPSGPQCHRVQNAPL
jgi:hypothetical protein